MKKVGIDESANELGSELNAELRDRTMTFPTSDAMLRAAVGLSREVATGTPAAGIARAYLARFSQLFPDRAFSLLWDDPLAEKLLRVAGPGCRLRDPEGLAVVPDSLLQVGGAAESCQVEAAFSVGPYAPVCRGAIAGFAIPLIVQGSVHGLFLTEYCSAAAVNGLDEELLPTLVEHLLTALTRAQSDDAKARELESQLIQSDKLANLGLMAAGIVHELNNPLTSVCVYADLLRSKLQTEGIDHTDQEKLDRIVDSATRVMSFARDLVSYARPSDAGAAPVAVVSSLEQAIIFCEHLIRDRGIDVRRNFGGGLPAALANRRELVQVWVNLITNACQAMPKRTGQLSIAAYRDGERVTVHICDNGPGISDDVRENLFTPFFSTKGEDEGTGLGLSIAKRIVERHHGRIWAENNPGGGGNLSVTLPIAVIAIADQP